MFLISIIRWWYTIGWIQRWQRIVTNFTKLADSFSLGIILKTLFRPWKQIGSLGNTSLIQRMVDNLISRFVGFFARVGVLVAGTIYILVVTAINIVVAIIWPAFPIAPIVFIYLSLVAL